MNYKVILSTIMDGKQALVLGLIISIVLIISSLIPPFQSPDEPAHVARAYLFSKGQILLETPPGQLAGGNVDRGLVAYLYGFNVLPFHPENKLSKEESFSVSDLRWTGQSVFMPVPGTGYYFPLAYAPQALALLLGEKLNWTVDHSYALARFFVLLSTVAVLTFAFYLFPTNGFVLGLLMMPMSIFQMASASLDAFTTGLTVLCIALFMRGCLLKFDFPTWMSWCMALCILILTTSRTHLLPLLVLPMAVWYVRRQRVLLWLAAFLVSFAMAWLLIAIKSTYVAAGGAGLSTGQTIGHYIMHPGAFVEVFGSTLGDPGHLFFYRNSLIGVLGWLDTYFPAEFYTAVSSLLVFLVVMTITTRGGREEWWPRGILLVLSLVSVFLVFLALLVTWNPVDAKFIEGVQGRYFFPPLLFFGYALSGSAGFHQGVRKIASVVILVILTGIVIFAMPRMLIERYFMVPIPLPQVAYEMRPSSPLARDTAIKIMMTSGHEAAASGLKRIGVMFGTYVRRNQGEAEFRLRGPQGESLALRFDLPDVADNQYQFFDLDSKVYTSGEIVAISGGGISTWESHKLPAEMYTCIVYEYANGTKRSTPGCPSL